jgi:hypothetical protein
VDANTEYRPFLPVVKKYCVLPLAEDEMRAILVMASSVFGGLQIVKGAETSAKL